MFLWSEEEIPDSGYVLSTTRPKQETISNAILKLRITGMVLMDLLLKEAVKKTFQISADYTFEMVVHLQKGLNEFRIFSLDRATIPVLPNGDERPLLVRLNDVHVLPFENKPQISLIA